MRLTIASSSSFSIATCGDRLTTRGTKGTKEFLSLGDQLEPVYLKVLFCAFCVFCAFCGNRFSWLWSPTENRGPSVVADDFNTTRISEMVHVLDRNQDH